LLGSLLLATNAEPSVDDDAGFAVSVVEDCCATPNPAWHEFAVQRAVVLDAVKAKPFGWP
jgi:hypothetical protein